MIIIIIFELFFVNYFQGITFKDFKNFFLFLNHMDDFTLMMRLYNLSDQPISKGKLLIVRHTVLAELLVK